MFKNYLLIAYRNLRKDKISSFVNIIGLSVGMACCMLIVIYIKDELSFNTTNINEEKIYRINWTSNINGNITPNASTPVPLATVIASDMPQVEQVTKMYQRSGGMQVYTENKNSDKKFQEQNVHFADSKLFSIFTIPFISGNPANALTKPNSVVVTDEMAKKYFGTENPIGKTLLYDTQTLLQVTGKNLIQQSLLKMTGRLTPQLLIVCLSPNKI